MRGGRAASVLRRVAHAARAGVRPRLPGRPRVAGDLRARRVQYVSPPRAKRGRGVRPRVGRARLGRRSSRVLPAGGKGAGGAVLAGPRPHAGGARAGSRLRARPGPRPVPRRGARRQARRAHAVPAAHPRAGGPRRVPDGHPRQLPAPVCAPAAGRLRGARARGRRPGAGSSADGRTGSPASTATSIRGTSSSRRGRSSPSSIGAAASGASRPTTSRRSASTISSSVSGRAAPRRWPSPSSVSSAPSSTRTSRRSGRPGAPRGAPAVLHVPGARHRAPALVSDADGRDAAGAPRLRARHGATRRPSIPATCRPALGGAA